jgi:hypothetical protein
MATNKIDPKETISVLKDVKKDQGDLNDILKDTISSLTKMANSYENIVGKIQSLNKSTINTKQLNKELEKSIKNRVVVENKIVKLEKELQNNNKQEALHAKEFLKSTQKISELEERHRKAVFIGDKAKQADLQMILAYEYKRNQRQKEGLSIQAAAYVGQLQALQIAKQQEAIVATELENEKDIAKSTGFTGKLLAISNKYLGIGGNLHEKIVLEAREGVSTTKNWIKVGALLTATFVGAFKAISGIGKFVGGQLISGLKALTPEGGGVVSGLTGGISSMAKNIPFIGGLVGGLIDGFSALLDVVVGVDDAIVKAGRNLGMTSGQARQLNRHFQDISLNQGDVFITSKKLLESYSELAGQLGINNKLSDETLQTNIKLKEFAGLELDTRSRLAEVSSITGKSTQGVVKGVLAQVKGLERATGIQFNYQQVLKEVTSLSGVLGLRFSKYPSQLTKSLLTIKAMGMEMKDLESMADSFLDFESSISKEMEAQILTGKELNFNKARELFLNNDLAGAAAEINRQVGSSAEFLKMNRIAAESFAQSMGMSRDQLADMLKKQELYTSIGAKGTENAREMYQLGLKRYGNEKAMAEAMGEQAFQSMQQASTQEKLMAFIEKIKQSVVDFIEKSGIIEKIEGFVNMLTNPSTIQGIIKWVRDAIAGAVEMVSGLIGDLFEVVAVLPFTDKNKWMTKAAVFKSGGADMASRIRSVGGDFGAATISQAAATNATASNTNTKAVNPYDIRNNQSMTTVVVNNLVDNRLISSNTHKHNVNNPSIDSSRAANQAPGIKGSSSPEIKQL